MTWTEKLALFYNDLESLQLKFPVAMLSEALGYAKGTTSSYLNKSKEPSEVFIDKFYEKYSESLKKVPRATHQETSNGTRIILDGKSEQIIYNLSESIRVQAEANREQAEGNNRNTKNTENLIRMLEEKTNSTAPGQNNITAPPIPAELLEALAELGSGKQWRSKEEALRELGMILNLHKPGTRSKGSILSDGRK